MSFRFVLVTSDRCQDSRSGRARATTDRAQIIGGGAAAPYNIGIATGPSGLLVVDCDIAAGSRSTSVASCGRWRGNLRASVAKNLLCQHPSGGLHLYFIAPSQPLGNTAGKLGAHIDTRGMGGYVVGPGSVCSGRFYMVVDHAPIAPLPTWITELLVPRRASRPPVAPHGRITSHYLRAILEGEVERVRSAIPGTRNDALNTAAFILGSARWRWGDHRRTRLVVATKREPTAHRS